MQRSRSSLILEISFLFLLSLSILSGCTAVDKKKNLPADVLLKQGIQKVKLDSYNEAKALFQQVLEDYPDSKERVMALLLLADTHYRDEEYEESKFHFQKFMELYPANQYTDRAAYYKAMSDFRMMEISTRDQTHTQAALEGFQKVIKTYPDSSYYAKAVKRKQECDETLAKNVFEIGKFYYRTGAYQAAILRLRKLMDTYPNLGFVDEAIFLIAESYYNEENFDKAKDSYKQLLNKYPKSEFALEARTRLKTIR